MPQVIIRRRFSIIAATPATANKTTARAATVPSSNSADLSPTMALVIGRRPVSDPDRSTQTLTRPPAGTPGLTGIMPSRIAPEGARHRPATQYVAIEPYP